MWSLGINIGRVPLSLEIHIYIWVFPKIWENPQIIHFNRVFHYKPSILGYPYFWKHPDIHQPFQVPKMEVLYPIRLFWVEGQPPKTEVSWVLGIYIYIHTHLQLHIPGPLKNDNNPKSSRIPSPSTWLEKNPNWSEVNIPRVIRK